MQLIFLIIHMCKSWIVSSTAVPNEPIVLKWTAEFGCLQSSDTTECRDMTSSVILYYSPPPFHLKSDWLLNKCTDISVSMCQQHTHIHTHACVHTHSKKKTENLEWRLIVHVIPGWWNSTAVGYMFFKTAFRDHKIERNNFTDSKSIDLCSILKTPEGYTDLESQSWSILVNHWQTSVTSY